jgi:hypothetical protein
MMRDRLRASSRWLACAGGALTLAACTAGGGAIVSTVPDQTPTPSMAVIPTSPTGDLSPVSISNPSRGAKDAFAKCHIGDQFSVEQVAGMGQVPSTKDLFHYVPLTGREPEFKTDVPAWVIQFRGDLPMRFGHWTDPACIVTPDYFGFYATGPSKNYGSDKVQTPEPPPTPPDRSLPPLIP